MANLKGALLIFSGLTIYIYWRSALMTDTNDRFLTIIEPPSLININSSSLLDLKDFRYVLHPRNVCGDRSHYPKIVLIVTSYAGEATARSSQRRAYSTDELSSLGIARIFLLATTTGKVEVSQLALEDEQRRFGDILQGSFVESYRNLTYKHVMGLKWASESCPEARYIIKMDDDIATNLYEILNIIDSHGQFHFLGYVFKKLKPKRVEANKWYVTRDEYSRNMYPTFVSGWLYVTTPTVAQRVVDKSRELPYFWIDDVFLTGVVAEELLLTHVNIGDVFTTFPESLDCCTFNPVLCQYCVGPSGGEFERIVRFQRHSNACRTNCSSSNLGRPISRNCLAKKATPQLGRGFGSLKIIKV